MVLELAGNATQVLSKASEECETKMENEVKKLTGLISQGVGGFKGQGAHAFFDLYEAWSQAVNRCVTNLNGFQAELGATELSLADADNDAAAASKRLLDRLGAGGNLA